MHTLQKGSFPSGAAFAGSWGVDTFVFHAKPGLSVMESETEHQDFRGVNMCTWGNRIVLSLGKGGRNVQWNSNFFPQLTFDNSEKEAQITVC